MLIFISAGIHESLLTNVWHLHFYEVALKIPNLRFMTFLLVYKWNCSLLQGKNVVLYFFHVARFFSTPGTPLGLK